MTTPPSKRNMAMVLTSAIAHLIVGNEKPKVVQWFHKMGRCALVDEHKQYEKATKFTLHMPKNETEKLELLQRKTNTRIVFHVMS